MAFHIYMYILNTHLSMYITPVNFLAFLLYMAFLFSIINPN